jgi:hypothetical protein
MKSSWLLKKAAVLFPFRDCQRVDQLAPPWRLSRGMAASMVMDGGLTKQVRILYLPEARHVSSLTTAAALPSTLP